MERNKKQSFVSIVDQKESNAANNDYKKVAAWFLGPKAENKEMYLKMVEKSLTEHANVRETYFEEEEPYIDDEVKGSEEFQQMCMILEEKRKILSDRLKLSVPFFSQRYQAHMLWDTVMAGSIGYITAILYNQNNVATEASSVTSVLEKEVGEQLCQLFDFTEQSWGHITADGTIANVESMWVARNLKAYPLSVQDLLKEPDLKQTGENLLIAVFDEGSFKNIPIANCSDWQLLNLDAKESLNLLQKVGELSDIPLNQLDSRLKPYLLAVKGIANFCTLHPDFSRSKILVPATHHYSWPKGATLIGLGQDSVIGIPVDEYCKMDMQILKETLYTCLEKHIPVLMVIAVMGSTAEGAVDNLSKIIDYRNQFIKLGLIFHLHCDAAWGGYLRSVIVKPRVKKVKAGAHPVPMLPLSDYAIQQYINMDKADTVTVDPHKAGFIPYPAGALCYRDKQLRKLITFNASYIHSEEDTNMGIYGLEGSKPGAAAAAVWLAHQTIPLDQTGYGLILGECSYSAKLNYCNWISLKNKIKINGVSYTYFISPLVSLPEQIKDPKDDQKNLFECREEIQSYIKDHIVGKNTDEIVADNKAFTILRNVGADVLMNTFVVNYAKDEVFNTDTKIINRLNEKLFERFSLSKENKKKPKLILMMNTLSSSMYGKAFELFEKEWGIKREGEYDLKVLVNTVLQPWPNTKEFMEEMMSTFSLGIETAITEIVNETN